MVTASVRVMVHKFIQNSKKIIQKFFNKNDPHFAGKTENLKIAFEKMGKTGGYGERDKE